MVYDTGAGERGLKHVNFKIISIQIVNDATERSGISQEKHGE